MEITLYDRIRPFLANIIAAVLIPLLAWLAEKTGIGLFSDPEFVESVKQVTIVWAMLVISKTLLNKRINPGNTSSAHLAKAQATQKNILTDNLERTHMAGSDPDQDDRGIL